MSSNNPEGLNGSTTKRLDTVEHEVSEIKTDVAGIKQNLINVGTQLSGISDSIKGISRNSQTNWGTLAAWATVILGVMLYHSSLVTKPYDDMLDKLTDSQITIEEKFHQHEKLGYHPEAKAKFESLKEDYTLTRIKLFELISSIDSEREANSIQIAKLTAALSYLEKEIDSIDAEQGKRTDKVYQEKDKP